MSKQNFEQLLAGTTPGLRRICIPSLNCIEVRTHEGATVCQIMARGDCDSWEGTEREDAELIARCNPATMKVVWEALNHIASGASTHPEDDAREALNLLNSAHPESKQP